MKCPCGSNLEYIQCCGKIHHDLTKAETALQLMKSRYAAYVLGKIDFVKASTHPKTRKKYDYDSLKNWSKSSEWLKLEIIDQGMNIPDIDKDEVTFEAHYVNAGKNTVHGEHSRFEKKKDIWYYVDGELEA